MQRVPVVTTATTNQIRTLERRQAWLEAISHSGCTQICPTDRVCSRHFRNGGRNKSTVATMKAIIAKHRENVLPSPAFTLLRHLTLCRLTLLNFRRGGETARLALSDWSDARHDLWIDQTCVKKMAPVEQEMFANLKVMYQTGKWNSSLFYKRYEETRMQTLWEAVLAIRRIRGTFNEAS